MTKFLKQYWPILAIALILIVLSLFYFPEEEKSYLPPEIKAIKKKSVSALLWTELGLFVLVFILVRKSLQSFKDFLILFFNIAMMGLGFFFLFKPIFLSATFFINKLGSHETVEKIYRLDNIDGKTFLMLTDFDTKKTIMADNLRIPNDRVITQAKDTVTVSFKKGLLGFNFDPTLKAN